MPYIRIAHNEGKQRRAIKEYVLIPEYSGAVNRALYDSGLLPEKGIAIGGIGQTWEPRLMDLRLFNNERAEHVEHSVREAPKRDVYRNETTLERRSAIAG